ncbi:MAG: serpin family protein [Bacilli bacterium]|nr:serpin family protein [Bacilli bacterium]
MNEGIESKIESLKDEAPKTKGSFRLFQKNVEAKTESRRKRNKKRIIRRSIVFASIASLLVLGIGSMFFEVKKETRDLSKRFSYNEFRLAENETFKRLNDFKYPEGGEVQRVSPEYEKAMNEFAFDLYSNVESRENIIINPFTSYLQLDLISHGASNNTLKEAFDSALHLSSDERDENFLKAFLTNRDKGSDSTSHIETYNAAFLDNKYVFKTDYLDYLTSRYCEAYSFDIKSPKDVSLMTNWANQRAKEVSISPSDFSFSERSALVFLSTMNFKGKWGFNKKDTKDMTFYTKEGTEVVVPGMKHAYIGSAYQYDGYWSFNMHFYGGYAIQFLTPDKREDDIHTLLKGKNFFFEKEENKYVPKNRQPYHDSLSSLSYIIDVTLPRFKNSNKVSFENAFKAMGLSSVYNPSLSLGNMFEEKTPSGNDLYVWVEESKQTNSVSWDEDGVVASTIEAKNFAAGAAMEMRNGVSFTFDSPFVYVIRDRNNLPIYVGSVDNFK